LYQFKQPKVISVKKSLEKLGVQVHHRSKQDVYGKLIDIGPENKTYQNWKDILKDRLNLTGSVSKDIMKEDQVLDKIGTLRGPSPGFLDFQKIDTKSIVRESNFIESIPRYNKKDFEDQKVDAIDLKKISVYGQRSKSSFD
jgi:hypothetical protein